MKSQILPLAVFQTAALVGALGQLFYKTDQFFHIFHHPFRMILEIIKTILLFFSILKIRSASRYPNLFREHLYQLAGSLV